LAVHVISYDLRKSNHDYAQLYRAIQAFGTYIRCLESVWLVKTPLAFDQVLDRLRLHVHKGDSLLVAPLAAGWATSGLGTACTDWLSKHVAPR